MNVGRVAIDPAIIFWGERQRQKVTCVAGTSSKYFKLHTASGGKYALWCEVDEAGSAPVLPGYTPVKIVLDAEPDAAETAEALALALNTLPGVEAEASGAVVMIQDLEFGEADPAVDGETASATGFTFAVETLGSGGELGHTSGDTEFTPSVETKEITSHQSGNSPLAELITKVAVDRISLTLLEVDKEQAKRMFSVVGHSEAAGPGKTVVGLGTKAVGGSLLAGAKKLVFHPKSRALDDLSEDVLFWKAAPIPGTLKFSGTDERTLTVEFAIYPDATIKSELDLFVYGDWSQDFGKV